MPVKKVKGKAEKSTKSPKSSSKSSSGFWAWVKAFLWAFFIVLLVRVFVFETYTVPTSSMEKTILVGDFVLVEKLSLGARFPKTILSLPFLHQRIPFTEHTKPYLKWIQLPDFRLPGWKTIERNNLLVFNYPKDLDYPIDHKTLFVKRCVAIAGDTLEIKNGEVYVNSIVEKSNDNFSFDYDIETNADLNNDKLNELGVFDGGKSGQNNYRMALNQNMLNELKSWPEINSIEKVSFSDYNPHEFLFPADAKFPFTIDNYGKIYIPKKGDMLKISLDNISVYEQLIRDYEGNVLEITNDEILINHAVTETYTVKQNYYFMMGDNRHHSMDSRFWGFVPENHILGKPMMTIFSINQQMEGSQKFRWNRIFKILE